MKVLLRGVKGSDMWSVEDWQRFGIFNMMISKIVRYGSQFGNEGHQDSAHDLIVYSAMLESLTP